MDHDRFVRFVKLSASVPGDAAEQAIEATLPTLAERLSKERSAAIVERLPEELVPCMAAGVSGQQFGADEFILRVALPEPQVRAVLHALRRAVGDDVWSEIAAELPPDFGSLLAPVDGIGAADFVARVARRTGLDGAGAGDNDGARKAVDAVLETLAERVAGDQIDELIGQLPVEFRAPLRRAKPHRDTPSKRMTIEQFVDAIAQREGATTTDEAVAHARGVLAVLHEALRESDFYNLVSQLPLDYSVLLPRP